MARTKIVLVAFVAMLALVAMPFGAGAATPGPTLARLDVTLQLTSPWMSVSITPGRIAAQRVSSVPADVTLSPFSQGWTINSSAPPYQMRTVTLRAVFEETEGAPVRVTVQKGFSGKALVDIKNTNYAPFQAAYVFNQLPQPSTGTPGTAPYSTFVVKTRSEFFGPADPPLTHADARPLVLAAYYPWWHTPAYSDSRLSDRPLDPRSTMEYPGVLSMTQQARSAGIDGFAMSWAGEEYSGWRFDIALAAAEATGGYILPYLEMMEIPSVSTGFADPYITIDWIADAITRASSPAFLRSGGVPVVFVFAMNRLTTWGWNNVLTELKNRGTPVRLVGDVAINGTNYGAVEWGLHRYLTVWMTDAERATYYRDTMLDARLLATNDAAGPHLTMATVSPGFNDTKFRGPGNPIVARGANGEHYSAEWNAALAADPDWILVTSWNEWFEGTSVEPSVLYGSTALTQTAQQSAIFKG